MPTGATMAVDAIPNAVGVSMGIVGTLATFVVANPLIMVFFAVAFVGLATTIFRKLRG